MIPSQLKPEAELRQIAAINFLTFAVRGLTLPFISLYLISAGFTATEIGILSSLSAMALLLLAPALHALADRTGCHRRLFYAMQITYILAIWGVAAPLSKVWLGGMNFLRDQMAMPSVALLSQLTITWLDEHGRAIYGRIRSWGSLGWAATAVVTGAIIRVGGYPLLFVIAGVMNLFILPLVKVLPERPMKHPEQHGKVSPRSPVFYLLLASLFLFYIGFLALTNFGFVYFRRDLGASDAMIGLIASSMALAEVPSMLLFDRVAKQARVVSLLVAGMLGQAVLWIGLSLISQPTLLIPLMLLRGPFFTLQNIAGALLVARISHPANVATNQALAQVTVPGLAVVLTGSLSGWIFDQYGPRLLLQLGALIGLISVALLILARRQLATQVQQQQEPLAAV